MTPPKDLVNTLRGWGQHDLADQVIASDIGTEDFEIVDDYDEAEAAMFARDAAYSYERDED